MPLSQWLITTNYYEGGYFSPDPLGSLFLFLAVMILSILTSPCYCTFSSSHLARLVCPRRFPSLSLALLLSPG